MSFDEEYLDDHHECRGEIQRQAGEIVRLTAELTKLTAERDEYRRLYDHRGKALRHPCLKCGYVPGIVKAADAAREGK